MMTGAYAAGVWVGLTLWAALAQYVLPGRGHALGKLGAFYWVPVINFVPALLCAIGFAVGIAIAGPRAGDRRSSVWIALGAGVLFPATARLLRPVLAPLGPGMMPALVWCVIGSAAVAFLLGRIGSTRVEK